MSLLIRLSSVFCFIVVVPLVISMEQLHRRVDEVSRGQLESCADRIADRIREVKVEPLQPRVIVLDFSNQDGNQRSLLGVALDTLIRQEKPSIRVL